MQTFFCVLSQLSSCNARGTLRSFGRKAPQRRLQIRPLARHGDDATRARRRRHHAAGGLEGLESQGVQSDLSAAARRATCPPSPRGDGGRRKACPCFALTISGVPNAASAVNRRAWTQNRENNPMQSRPGPFKVAEFVTHDSRLQVSELESRPSRCR